MFVFPQPQYLACPECGECVHRQARSSHECDPQRWLDYQLVRLRPGIARFEADLAVWAETTEGRFAVFYAERSRP
jgi:hypothetical protein